MMVADLPGIALPPKPGCRFAEDFVRGAVCTFRDVVKWAFRAGCQQIFWRPLAKLASCRLQAPRRAAEKEKTGEQDGAAFGQGAACSPVA